MNPAVRIEARRMRWTGGMTYAAIAAALAIDASTAHRLCDDMPILCDPRCRASTARRRRAEERAVSRRREARRAALALDLRAEGRTLVEPAAVVEVGAAGRATPHLGVDPRGSAAPRRRPATGMRGCE